jgi:hypothetical protein
MSADTCAVLTAVFPLVVLAILTERRNVALKVRRTKPFRLGALWGSISSAFGLPLAVIGVQIDGFGAQFAWVAWLAFAVATASLVLLVMLHIATAENEEDA